MLERFERLYQQLILESRKDQYIEQLNNKNVNNIQQLADYLFAFNNPKKEKVALHWLLKGTIKLPEDQKKLDQAYNLIDKQHLNYQQFNSPEDVINRSDKSTQRINTKYEYNPDDEPAFFNKKKLGDGVTVYWVKDNEEGRFAVRKAVDICWGESFNNWCLVMRDFDNNKLDGSFYWYNKYNAYPKRIAFKNGKLLAFCAGSENIITWWNREDKQSRNIPGTNVKDDLDFILKYAPITILESDNCPVEIIQKFSKNKNIKLKQAAIMNKNCPIEILQKLSKNRDNNIRESVAENPNCPKELLQKLSNDLELNVRAGVAQNPNTPIELLQKLSNDEYRYVRKYVALNPNCPLEIFQKLSNDSKEEVRWFILYNNNCPLEILKKLSNDKDKNVRKHVARHKNCPHDILEKLSKDQDKDVRDIAQKRLKELQK